MNTQPIVKSATESNTGPGKIKNSKFYFILTHSYFLYQLYINLHI